MDCKSDIKSSENDFEDAFCLLFYNDEILVKEDENIIHIPSMNDINMLDGKSITEQYTDLLSENAYYVANICNKDIFVGFSFKKLRHLSRFISDECLGIVFRAFHIINWLKNNKYCGRCGGVMQLLSNPQELAVKCLACGRIVYPRISPAIIVAVVKENEILLARSNQFPSGFYSVIAGFVEPGETLENCVRREVKEEVGIDVDNITYFGNQPWPFPESLMIAYTAEYVNGEITIDDQEIADAGWFSAAMLPKIPGRGSIARQLIDWFLKK